MKRHLAIGGAGDRGIGTPDLFFGLIGTAKAVSYPNIPYSRHAGDIA